MDHVVLVLFDTGSLDNFLGHLCGSEDANTFEGVIGRDLRDSIPEWAEHGAERETVPYTVRTASAALASEQIANAMISTTAAIVPALEMMSWERRIG
jgi:hypothetical protein